METIKKNQSEVEDTLTEMKNNLQGINSRVDEAENQNNHLEHKEAKNTHAEQQKERKDSLQNEDSVRSFWNKFKCTNMCIMGLLEEVREQENETYLKKLVMGNLPNPVNEIDTQVQRAQRVPNKMNPKRPVQTHIIIKMPKVKDKKSI